MQSYIALEAQFHREILQGYIDVVIYRDIVERYGVTNAHVLKELITYCLQNCASLLSINKVYHRFKSQGKSISKNSLYQFMEYLQDAYCIFSVPLYSFSRTKQTLNPKKIYAVDQGLITAYTVKPHFEQSSLLENTVFCKTRRKTEEIFYYRTKSGREVDFLAVMPDKTRHLYQVCLSLSDEETFDREITALTEAMDELDIKRGTIVTLSDNKTLHRSGRTIQCIPLWKWLI